MDVEGLDPFLALLEPLIFFPLHRANAAMTDPAQAGTLKVFVLDEAWRFLRYPTLRQFRCKQPMRVAPRRVPCACRCLSETIQLQPWGLTMIQKPTATGSSSSC